MMDAEEINVVLANYRARCARRAANCDAVAIAYADAATAARLCRQRGDNASDFGYALAIEEARAAADIERGEDEH